MNLNICTPLVLGALLLIVSGVRGQDSGCGGILDGTTGSAGFLATTGEVTRSNCIWIISPDRGNEVAFTLKDISADSSILLYEVGQSAPLGKLGQGSIDSSISYAGKRFLVVFPVEEGSKVTFEWQMSGEANEDENYVFDAFYSENVTDAFVHTYMNETGSFAVVANLDKKYEVYLEINLVGVSDDETSQCLAGCECMSADAFEVLPSGLLGRLVPDRLCMKNGYSKMDANPQVVIWGNFKVPETDLLGASTVWFPTYEATPATTGTTPSTTPPGFANTILASKALVLLGLIALYFPFQSYTS